MPSTVPVSHIINTAYFVIDFLAAVPERSQPQLFMSPFKKHFLRYSTFRSQHATKVSYPSIAKISSLFGALLHWVANIYVFFVIEGCPNDGVCSSAEIAVTNVRDRLAQFDDTATSKPISREEGRSIVRDVRMVTLGAAASIK